MSELYLPDLNDQFASFVQKLAQNFEILADLFTAEGEPRVGKVAEELDMLRSGGTEYTATLQNGWTGDLKYRKIELGLVIIYGHLIAPGELTTRHVVTTLPAGYRPIPGAVALPAYNNSLGRVLLFGKVLATGVFALELSIAKEAQEVLPNSVSSINIAFWGGV